MRGLRSHQKAIYKTTLWNRLKGFDHRIQLKLEDWASSESFLTRHFSVVVVAISIAFLVIGVYLTSLPSTLWYGVGITLVVFGIATPIRFIVVARKKRI